MGCHSTSEAFVEKKRIVACSFLSFSSFKFVNLLRDQYKLLRRLFSSHESLTHEVTSRKSVMRVSAQFTFLIWLLFFTFSRPIFSFRAAPSCFQDELDNVVDGHYTDPLAFNSTHIVIPAFIFTLHGKSGSALHNFGALHTPPLLSSKVF